MGELDDIRDTEVSDRTLVLHSMQMLIQACSVLSAENTAMSRELRETVKLLRNLTHAQFNLQLLCPNKNVDADEKYGGTK